MSSASCYAYGNCTAGVAALLPWIPCGLGNAVQWFGNAKARGLPTGPTPRVGSVVVYENWPPGCASNCIYDGYGHVAVVIAVASPSSFTVKEMNYYADGGGYNRYDERQSGMTAVLGFIYPPGGAPPPPIVKVTKTSTTTTRTKAAALVLLGGAALVGGAAVYQHPDFLAHAEAQLAREERRAIGFVRSRL